MRKTDDAYTPDFEEEDERPRKSAGSSARFVFKGLPVHELVGYYDEIGQLLPPLSLADIDLEKEMLLQFHSTRSLQSEVISDADVPANQRAQVANAAAAALAKLSDLQERLYTTERLKAIEKALINCLNKLPPETAEEFLDEYRAVLEKLGGKSR